MFFRGDRGPGTFPYENLIDLLVSVCMETTDLGPILARYRTTIEIIYTLYIVSCIKDIRYLCIFSLLDAFKYGMVEAGLSI